MNEIIKIGLRFLTVNDFYLLENDVNERSITHKMGKYYSILFPGWDVDCEFNRNIDGPKEIEIDPVTFLNDMADFLERETSERSNSIGYSLLREAHVEEREVLELKEQLRDPNNMVYDEELDLVAFILRQTDGKKITKPIFPDIIVHHRGTVENLVVIEAKKTSNTNRSARLYDLVKLHILTSDPKYSYEYGFFIDVPTRRKVNKLIEFETIPYRFNGRMTVVTPKE